MVSKMKGYMKWEVNEPFDLLKLSYFQLDLFEKLDIWCEILLILCPKSYDQL